MKPVLVMAAVLAVLPGYMEGCGSESCPGDAGASGILTVEDLCGDSPTAVSCQVHCPGDTSAFLLHEERLIEESVYLGSNPNDEPGATRRGRLTMVDVGPAQLFHRRVQRYDGTPVAPPLVALRSDGSDLEVGVTRMSAYFRVSDIRDGCVIDMKVAWSWTLREKSDDVFANDFEAAYKVSGISGSCDTSDPLIPRKGDAWKVQGMLFRPGACHGGGPWPSLCEADGFWNPFCDYELDNPCHHDGVCEEFCPGDLDCDCGRDDWCNPNCFGTDPDCVCGGDGWCNALCPHDPDCDCTWNGHCNEACPHDPDCDCVEDDFCNPICGWLDPDCQCIEDGLCNPECEWDPDCECALDEYCNPECDEDPDCPI